MVKKSENLKKAQKISKNHFIFKRKKEIEEEKKLAKKKCYPLSFAN